MIKKTLLIFGPGGIEFTEWAFPEYVYGQDRVETLAKARKALIARLPAISQFLLSEDEIRPIALQRHAHRRGWRGRFAPRHWGGGYHPPPR